MQRILSTILLLIPFLAHAQGRPAVSGTIRDAASGETLIGASVFLAEQPRSAVLSNSYGFYSINAPAGHYTLIVSFTGYKNDTLPIDLTRDITHNIQLSAGG